MSMQSILRIRTAFAFVALGAVLVTASAPAFAQEAFETADQAVTALVDAVRSDDPEQAIVKVLGPGGREIASSGDEVDDQARRNRFLTSFDAAHSLESEGEGKVTLLIGTDVYPFPIPIVQTDGKWKWDTAAGLDQLLTRRIGENELSAIEVMKTYVAAQLEYAEQSRDGNGIQYARRLMSREGRKDGLYWETAEGEPESPIGPLVAKAQREGYKGSAKRADGQADYHGYVYRMLYGQGKNATGGARDFIVNNRMIGGFALIATPADYENSGVMTFIINQDGVVYEKDLGPESAQEAARIKIYDPDTSWRKVDEE